MRSLPSYVRWLAVLGVLLAGALSPAGPAAASQPGSEAGPTPPSEPVLARVYYAGVQDLGELARTLDVWEVHPDRSYLLALLTPARYAALHAAGYRVETEPGSAALLAEPATRAAAARAQAGPLSGIPGYPCYRTVEETYADMAALAAGHPDLAEWTRIGSSWESVDSGGTAGYGLFVLKLTNRAITLDKPRFFLMAEVHARELTTAETAARFAEYLVSQYGTDPDVTWLLDYQEVHILVMANPDGRKLAEQGYYWRKNTDPFGCADPDYWGIDLNRNSSFAWNAATDWACGEQYPGPSPASEPETQALQSYLSGIFPDQRGPNDDDPAPADATGLFISLHSYAAKVLFPWGWTTDPAPNQAGLQTLGRKFGYYNRYQVCASGGVDALGTPCMYPTLGTNDDWAYGVLGLATYTFEMGSAFFESCQAFEGTVYPANLSALLYAFKAARRPYQTPAGPESIHVAVSPDAVPRGMAATLTAQADDTLYDSGGWGNEAVQDVVAARYSIDAPSWVEGVAVHPMVVAAGAAPAITVTATVDTAGLAAGRHILFVESQDAAGNWGVPAAVFLSTVSLQPAAYLPMLGRP